MWLQSIAKETLLQGSTFLSIHSARLWYCFFLQVFFFSFYSHFFNVPAVISYGRWENFHKSRGEDNLSRLCKFPRLQHKLQQNICHDYAQSMTANRRWNVRCLSAHNATLWQMACPELSNRKSKKQEACVCSWWDPMRSWWPPESEVSAKTALPLAMLTKKQQKQHVTALSRDSWSVTILSFRATR
jgi:hypothetical protein